MKISRRRFLTNSGVVLFLPLLESLVPSQVFAAAQTRRKFIAVFTPSGMRMVKQNGITSNGNWTFDGALKPVVDAGYRNNLMILRGLQSTKLDQDPHWGNTAGFLSCMPMQLAQDRPLVCGKSFDQYLADAQPTPMRSLHVGWKPMNRDFTTDHGAYNNAYLENVAWRAPNRPIYPSYSTSALFNSIFTANAKGQAHLMAASARRKSVLDFVLSDVQALKRSLAADDVARLESFTDGVRTLEATVAKATVPSTNQCAGPNPIDLSDSKSPDRGDQHAAHFRVMHQIVAQALACDLITSATIMYDDGVGDNQLDYLGLPDVVYDHHGYAHQATQDQAQEQHLKDINLRHGSLFADLIRQVDAKNLLPQTLLLWGSNMADGIGHSTDNLPFVIAGAGSDLRFGQEVGSNASPIEKADLFVELAQIYGMTNLTSFGSGEFASKGKLLGLRA